MDFKRSRHGIGGVRAGAVLAATLLTGGARARDITLNGATVLELVSDGDEPS